MQSFNLLLSNVSIWLFAGLLLIAAWTDIKTLQIPNRLTLGIALLYPVYVLSAPLTVDWMMALAIAGGVLFVGFLLFTINQMGGGDVKLLSATALWAGSQFAVDFILLTAIAGAVLSVAVLMQTRYGWVIGWFASEEKRNVPYGVAIAAGGLFVFGRLMSA